MAKPKQDLVPAPTKDVALFEDRMKAMAVRSAKQEATRGGGVISIQGGVLNYMGQEMPNNQLEVVVLDSGGEHSYYDTPFDRDRIVPPTCFAVFNLEDEPVPHHSVQEPQSDKCSTCWAHKFKSADNGRGRACSVRRRLALVPAMALASDDGLEDAEIAVLKVPPTSVDTWGKYVNMLAAKYQRPPFMLQTMISVSKHPKFQYVVEFEATELVEMEYFETLANMSEGVEGMLQAPFDMTPKDDEEEAPVRRTLKSDRKPVAIRNVTKKVGANRR